MSQPASQPLACQNDGNSRPDEAIEARIACSREDITAAIRQGLREKFGGDPQPDDSLAAAGIDSLGMAEFSLEIEKRFGVKVDEDILNVETVADLTDYIYAKSLQRSQ
jgi:acyl carrier protein